MLLLVLCCQLPTLAVDSKKAEHIGGTLESIIPPKTKCIVKTDNEKILRFITDKGGGEIEIPYATIDTIEYGQKVSFRTKTAILVTPWALFSKKRRHYLSITWKDKDNKKQAAVFEIGSDILRPTVLIIEVRSGKKVTFQDEDAKKHFAK